MKFINSQKKLRGSGGCCGWIATINALKWLGFSISYKRFTKGVDSELLNSGLYNNQVKGLMRTWGIKFKTHKNPSVRDIEKVLNQGKAVVLNYYWIDDENKKENYERGHATFIHGHNKDNFFIENILHVSSKKALRDFFKVTRQRNLEENEMYVISR
jgi:hypothetical protein